jgi:glycosyltransferase involved in cell wall biosynthesis
MESADIAAMPFVSIILPIRNEGRFIQRGLDAVLRQDYPADRLEVIVSDGMSTDSTRQVVESCRDRHANVRLIDNPRRIVSTGLNAAIPLARGEIIVRVDGHCEIAPDYVRRCVTHLLQKGVDGVGGVLDTVGETHLARVIAAAMSTPFGVGNSAFRTTPDKTMLTDTVAFPAYTRAAIEKAGPYDEELVRNQDDEYNYRLRKLGAKLLLASDVRSTYYSRSSLRSLWRQYFQYGYFKVRVLQMHALQMMPRQFAPPLFVAALLLGLVTAPLTPLSRYALAVLAGLYLAANVGASILTARQKGCKLFPLLPVAFATLHLSYGLGFLLGLVKFWNRWGGNDKRPLSVGVPAAHGDKV